MKMKWWLYILIVFLVLDIAVITSYVYFKNSSKSEEPAIEKIDVPNENEMPLLVEETEPEKTEEEKQQEAERRRKAELEAEKRRKEQQDDERRRQERLEAERKRQAKMKAEKIRLQRWNAMLSESYAVDMYNDYSALASDESGEQIRSVIDTQIKQRLEGFYPKLLTIQTQSKIPFDKPIDELTKQDLATLNGETTFIGRVSKVESGLKIQLRTYSKAGNFLSNVASAEVQIQNEIAVKYSRLAIESLPLLGKVTQKSGRNIQIVLKGGNHLGKLSIQKHNYFWLADKKEIIRLSSVKYRSDINRLVGVLLSNEAQQIASHGEGQPIQVDATVISAIPEHTIEKEGMDKISALLLVLHDDSGSPLQNCKVYASTTGYSDAKFDFVQRTNLRGEVKLDVRGGRTIYVTVKRHDDVIARFETSAEKGPVDRKRITSEGR